MTIVVRYRAQDRSCIFEVNRQLAGSTTFNNIITDRTFSGTYVGRSLWPPPHDSLNGDIAGLHVKDKYASDGKTAQIANKNGLDLTTVSCLICEADTYSPGTGSDACTPCPMNSYAPASSTSPGSCVCNTGYDRSAGGDLHFDRNAGIGSFFFGICFTLSSTMLVLGALKKRGKLGTLPGQIILGLMVLQDVTAADCPRGSYHVLLADTLSNYPAYLVATASSWDQSKQEFQDLSGNGRVGRLTAGSASVGTIAGNGAGAEISIRYVGGSTSTKILWGSLSVPSTFTICSITRYSGAAKQRILTCKNRNWLHGHWGYRAPYAGATFYDMDINLQYTITSNTNWVVACGRNVVGSGQVGTIIISLEMAR